MPRAIAVILDSRITAMLGRLLLCLPFWAAGLVKLFDFRGTVEEMAFFGLQPAVGFSIAVIITQLLGSFLIVINRGTWVGAGALAIFTALTIPIVHHFWSLEGPQAQIALYFAMEHVGMIGAFILVAVLSHRGQRG